MSSPTADDVKKILTAVNAKVDETCLAKVNNIICWMVYWREG
jgi:hypothetical protein